MNPLHKNCIAKIKKVSNELGFSPDCRHYFTTLVRTPDVPKTRGYNPDVVIINRNVGKLAVFEVETQPGPGKVIEDLVCTKLLPEKDNIFKSNFNPMLFPRLFIVTHLSAKKYVENWLTLVSGNILNVHWPEYKVLSYEPLADFEDNIRKEIQSFFNSKN